MWKSRIVPVMVEQTSAGLFPIIGPIVTPVQSLFIVPRVLLMVPDMLLMVPELLMVPSLSMPSAAVL